MVQSIAVCDDSIEYGNIVATLIREVLKKNNLEYNVFIFKSGNDLLNKFKENNFDIVFLDMEMPEISGIETGLKIRENSKSTVILYLTSHKEYAYESYKVKAKDYLLKPVNVSVIEKVLMECVDENRINNKLLSFKDISGIIHRIPISDITHIVRKKEDRKVHIYCMDNTEVLSNQTLESVENELTSCNCIVRAGKSCIINLENVKEINKNIIYFRNNVKEEASRRCLPNLTKKLLRNAFNNISVANIN